MLVFDEIRDYCNKVCDQIRWKKVKPIIAQEIKSHILDQRDAYMSLGENEEEATKKAIEQMGDPIIVGESLNRTHRPKPQWTMIIFTVLLMGVGMWANYAFRLADSGRGSFDVLNMLFVVGIFLLCYFGDFTILGKYAKEIYFCSLIIPLLYPIIEFRNTVIGGRLYFGDYGGSIRLTYIALVFPLFFALAVYALGNKGFMGIVLSGAAYLPFGLMLALIPSSAGFIIYSLSALGILCFAIVKGWFGVNKKHGLLVVFIPVLIIFVGMKVFVLQRDFIGVMSFFEPEVYQEGQGYWYLAVREFLSNSVFWGRGSIPQLFGEFSSFPTIDSDYLLIYLVYRYGFWLLISLVMLILTFSVIGIRKVFGQKSMLAFLIGMAIMLTFVFESLFYIMGNMGLSFFEPIALPFVSYGMMGKCINAALIGFLLSVFRTGDLVRDNLTLIGESSVVDNEFISYKDGRFSIRVKDVKRKG